MATARVSISDTLRILSKKMEHGKNQCMWREIFESTIQGQHEAHIITANTVRIPTYCVNELLEEGFRVELHPHGHGHSVYWYEKAPNTKQK